MPTKKNKTKASRVSKKSAVKELQAPSVAEKSEKVSEPVRDPLQGKRKISVQLSNIVVWGDDLADPHTAIFEMLQQDPNRLVNLLWPNLLVNVTTIDENGEVMEAKAVKVKPAPATP